MNWFYFIVDIFRTIASLVKSVSPAASEIMNGITDIAQGIGQFLGL